ncbi:MAG: hypothetical protein ACOYOI_08435 [Chthoniobacterales bacterium]
MLTEPRCPATSWNRISHDVFPPGTAQQGMSVSPPEIFPTGEVPTDEKDLLQSIADNADVTLSDAVVRAVRDFIEAHPVPTKAKAKR